jgi:ABC-2 type transport system permease protein
MRVYCTLTRRELGSYFLSITGYIILAAAAAVLGWSYVVLMRRIGTAPTPVPLTEIFYSLDFFWLVVLIAPPVITMRLFALEKFSGTFETLMSSPVSDLQVVLAKFTAGLLFYLIIWLPLLGCIFAVRHFGHDPGRLDLTALGTTFLGITLLGGMLVSVGCCASALTRNQAVAAIISLAFGITMYLLAVLASGQNFDTSSWKGRVLSSFALIDQMQDFSRGIVDTRPVVFLVTVTLFFLFLNLRIIESRRWK